MSIYVALLLFAIIILLYWGISELFTILFSFTGLPEEKARFQVMSLLTGCGFTTRESEIIITSRVRRRLARVTMLFGYVFNITIVSAFINIVLSLKMTATAVRGISRLRNSYPTWTSFMDRNTLMNADTMVTLNT